MENRRPPTQVAAVTLHNTHNDEGEWIPTRYERLSWVRLNPGRSGIWAREARRHGGDTMRGSYKAQIVDFRFKVDGRRLVSNKPELESVLVRHAYQRHQVLLDPEIRHDRVPCNFLYQSFFEDWVDPASILGVILVVHSEIGEATRNGRSYNDLLDNGIFFSNLVYVPPTPGLLYGTVEPLLLPSFTDPEWPLPDMHTSEAFRFKLRQDFQTVTKATTGSRMGHLQWFVPLHVFVDLFAPAEDSIRRTATLYVLNSPSEELFTSLMDPGWHQKVVFGKDIVRCTILVHTVTFRYHVGRSTLYTNFKYGRERLGQDGVSWQQIDQVQEDDMVVLPCLFEGVTVASFEVGRTWPLSHVRREICITLGNIVPEEFRFRLHQIGLPDVYINRRHENANRVAQVLPPWTFEIVAVTS